MGRANEAWHWAGDGMSETPDAFTFNETDGLTDHFEMLSSEAGGGIIGGVQPDGDADGLTDTGESVVGIDTDLNDGPPKQGNV